MLAMLCAISQEFNGLLRKVDMGRTASEYGFRICEASYKGEDMLLVQTGAGKEKAEQATEYVLQGYSIEGIVSLGFAGALDERLAVGDLVLCQTLYCQTSPGEPFHCDNEWVSSFLVQVGTKLHKTSSLTVGLPACDPPTKKALARGFPAAVVEMESYWIGQIARSQGVPFLCIRSISDTLSDHLPPPHLFNADGNLRKGRTVLYSLARPWWLARLARLYRNMWQARESLAKSLEVTKYPEK